MSKRLQVKYPLFMSDFNETWTFSTDFRQKAQIQSFIKNPSNGSRVVPCGQTDMTKLIVAFRNFANAPKIALGMRVTASYGHPSVSLQVFLLRVRARKINLGRLILTSTGECVFVINIKRKGGLYISASEPPQSTTGQVYDKNTVYFPFY
jgi:hypothetical protein